MLEGRASSRKAPSSKHQGNPNSQTPNPKFQRVRVPDRRLGIWNWGFVWGLEFGYWDLLVWCILPTVSPQASTPQPFPPSSFQRNVRKRGTWRSAASSAREQGASAISPGG